MQESICWHRSRREPVLAFRPRRRADHHCDGLARGSRKWRKANHRAVPAADVLLNEMVQRLAMVERARAAGLEKDTDTRLPHREHADLRLRERELGMPGGQGQRER